MVKRTEIFWIQFAGLYCRVVSTPEMKYIFSKYFSGTYVSISGQVPASPDQVAELVIYQKQTELTKTSVVIKKNKLRFVMYIDGSPHFFYPLFANILQRIFMALVYNSGGIVFHASAVESKGKAHVFVGESGKGKTTVAKLSNDLYGLRVLADNQVFIRRQGEKYFVYPFPFSQFHKDGDNVILPIEAFYILHKSSSFTITSLSFIERVRALGHDIQILNPGDFPSDTQIPLPLRRTIFDFTKTVIIKRLYFYPRMGFWEAIYGAS